MACTVCEIFAFKLYCDLETEGRGHSRSAKAALFEFNQSFNDVDVVPSIDLSLRYGV